MAVAAYASVLSLLRVIDNVQHPSHLRFFPDPTQFDALREELSSLQDFLEVHSSAITEDVARKILRVTCDAEILINNYVVDQLYRELNPQNDGMGCNIDSIHDEIHRVMEEIAPINVALKTVRAIQHDQEKPVRVLNMITSKKPLNNDRSLTSFEEKNKMVGFDYQLRQVLEKLTGNQPDLMIVPIVGMGGIGKTTLARNVFDHRYNLHHFPLRIWVTISQDYSVKKVLQELLECGVLGEVKDGELGHESDESELIMQLHQKLFGQRYLIVLDDVWSLEAWYDLKRGFPNNGKGSRVIVTTRLSDIASSLDSQNNSHSMKFLDEDKSWDLFSEKAFEHGGRSPELEELGREISARCKGLPLLLVVVGGLLVNSNMTIEYWQTVAEDINSFANSVNDEHCLRILSLSYHHLPIHLKPCFLYMRYFTEDSKVSELIKGWVSEGFVKPMRGKSLEEAARNYLEDLIGRNMLMIKRRSGNGDIKSCGIHDLLRDLSIKESNKEQLWELQTTMSVDVFDIDEECFVCNVRRTDTTTFEMVCSSCESTYPKFARSRFVVAVELESQNVPLPTTCRWIGIYTAGGISVFETIRLIWNLEILDIKKSGVDLPKELWEMPRLRHVKARSFTLPDPVSTNNDVVVLENLQTLRGISQLNFAEEITRRIPNLRELGVWYDGECFSTYEEEDSPCFFLQNITHLQKLELLSIECSSISVDFNDIAFPCSLRKLILEGCMIAWDDLTIIGSLPNLQVLKLCYQSVSGEEWDPIEGEFLRLKYLRLSSLNLVHWRVSETHFPALETLFLDRMKSLEAIPQEIGELPSLNLIYLRFCRQRTIDSAKDIVEEQLSNGNERLALHVEGWEGLVYQLGGANHS